MSEEVRNNLHKYISRNFSKFIDSNSPMYWDKDFVQIFPDDLLDEVQSVVNEFLHGNSKYESIGQIVSEYLHLPAYFGWLLIADTRFFNSEDTKLYDWLNLKLKNL